jgi:hypothetical protein
MGRSAPSPFVKMTDIGKHCLLRAVLPMREPPFCLLQDEGHREIEQVNRLNDPTIRVVTIQ